MNFQLIQINVKQTAKVLATVVFLVNSLFSVIGLISLALGAESTFSFNFIMSITVTGAINKAALLIVMPGLSFIFAYIATAVLCMIYNFSSKYTGGVFIRAETVEEKGNSL